LKLFRTDAFLKHTPYMASRPTPSFLGKI